MNIQIQGIRYEPNDKDEEMVTQKIGGLDKFMSKDDSQAFAQVDLECVEKTHDHKKDIFRVEVTIENAGTIYRAEETRRSLVTALTDVKKKLSKEIRRKNDKQRSMMRRGKKKIADMFGG